MSRTFGDIEAKRARFGGNPNVIISEPEIRSFKLQDSHDFLLIGCDGIFDRMTNKDVISTVWESALDLVGLEPKSSSRYSRPSHSLDSRKYNENKNKKQDEVTIH